MKDLKKYISGAIVGALLMVGTTAVGAAVKEYKLTKVTYPVVVNNKTYNDPSMPILNYNGSTYIPLAKIADLTGVEYKWNSQLKRVEIGDTNSSAKIPTEDLGDYGIEVEAENALKDVIDKVNEDIEVEVIENPNNGKTPAVQPNK